MPEAPALIDLGDCKLCQGDLCISGWEVCCEKCGHVELDHPYMQVMQESTQPAINSEDGTVLLNYNGKPANLRKPKEKPVVPAVKPADYALSWIDRIVVLEKLATAQTQQLQAQTEQIKRLERLLADINNGGRRQR